jgi:hypothetical protein
MTVVIAELRRLAHPHALRWAPHLDRENRRLGVARRGGIESAGAANAALSFSETCGVSGRERDEMMALS